jgi:hypothetical protein
MSVRQLLESMDSSEVSEWRHFLILEAERMKAKPIDEDVEGKLRNIFSSANE